MKITNPDLPQHNQGILEEFIEKDMTSKKQYFCFIKKNNGTIHILSNVFGRENLEIVFKDFLKQFDVWLKARKKAKIK